MHYDEDDLTVFIAGYQEPAVAADSNPVEAIQWPEFPREFVEKHCPKVLEARDWRSRFGIPPNHTEDVGFAECSFEPAGFGMACEACDLHLTRPYCGHELDEEWLPRIEEYYQQVREIEEKTGVQAPRRMEE